MMNDPDTFMKKKGKKRSKGNLIASMDPQLRPGTCRDKVRVP